MKMLIGGRPAGDGAGVEVVNPFDGSVVGTVPEATPEETEELTPIKLETIEGVSGPVEESKKAPELVGLETSEDQISNSLMEIISIINEPLSRVRTKARPTPAVTPQPTTPTPVAPYPERPPEEAP